MREGVKGKKSESQVRQRKNFSEVGGGKGDLEFLMWNQESNRDLDIITGRNPDLGFTTS